MTDSIRCQRCGAAICAGTLADLCPNCLLRVAIDTGTDRFPAESETSPLLSRLRHFGDYELEAEIARGGMGVVYRARQISLERTVALKMMRPGLLATDDEVRRFQVEAKLAGALQHPHIIAIHEVGEHDGLHYFSMDYVEGLSLAEMIREQPLAPSAAARYVGQIAEAIHYAHSKGVLHRDLKPSNVLVDLTDQPRVTDFGLARPIHADTGMTVTGAVMGTPAYMSPEQASGNREEVTPASDVYSLGAVLFELLTGKPPFQGATSHETLQLVLEAEPPSPRDLNAQVPRDLATICRKCLEKDPARRYGSAEELASDLERFLNGENIEARPVTIATHAWRWCRRNPWPVVAFAALSLLILVSANALIFSRPNTPPANAASGPLNPPASSPVDRSGGEKPPGPLQPKSAGSAFAPSMGAAVDLPREGFRATVIAGPGDIGDGELATKAWLPRPDVVAADAAGNLYIGDTGCHCIRKVGLDGFISRVAGNGEMGTSPDGTKAIEARLNTRMPLGFAVDSNGIIYFAEYEDCRVRKVGSDGRLATVAGTGVCGFGGDGGPATRALLNQPRSLAVGPDGRLFICDDGNSRIRAVQADGTIHTLAGNGSFGSSGDGGPALSASLATSFQIAADPAGNVFLRGECRIRGISNGGVIQTVVGTGTCGFDGDGGPATSARIGNGQFIATDARGNLYIGDETRIRQVRADGTIHTVAGNGKRAMTQAGLPATDVSFLGFYNLAASPAGEIFVVEYAAKRVLKIESDGIVRVAAGTTDIQDGLPAGQTRLNGPFSALTAPNGTIYIADTNNGRILHLGLDNIVRVLPGALGENHSANPNTPYGLAVDAEGSVYVSERSCSCVIKILPDGSTVRVAGTGTRGYSGDDGPAAQAQLSGPMGLAFDSTGSLYIADGATVRRVGRDGVITTVAGRSMGFSGDGGQAKDALFKGISGVALDLHGNLLIADSLNYRVRRVTPSGVVSTIAGNGRPGHAGAGGPATEAAIGAPVRVTTDAAGTVYFTDPDFHCIWMLGRDGILRKAVDLPHPLSVAANPDGTLIVADDWNNRIYRLTPQR